jgi:hypothetical protein
MLSTAVHLSQYYFFSSEHSFESLHISELMSMSVVLVLVSALTSSVCMPLETWRRWGELVR